MSLIDDIVSWFFETEDIEVRLDCDRSGSPCEVCGGQVGHKRGCPVWEKEKQDRHPSCHNGREGC
jgi:hypothetical protein